MSEVVTALARLENLSVTKHVEATLVAFSGREFESLRLHDQAQPNEAENDKKPPSLLEWFF